MKIGRASSSLGGLVLAVVLALPVAAATLHVGGTGAATQPLRQIGARFGTETGIQIDVIAGLGSAGGISAAAENVLQLVVSARPLSAAEEAKGLALGETVCTPYVFASSHHSPGSMAPDALAAIYAQSDPKWPDGTPIRIILRPKAESDNAIMANLFPGMAQGLTQARTRDSVPIGATDQDNADLAEHIPGSLIGTTYAQIVTERRALRFVALNGELPGLEAFESGRYPFPRHLLLIVKHDPAPEAARFLAFLRTQSGVQAMREVGIVPCPK
jgi:phosphate transport system substrate-binding protein